MAQRSKSKGRTPSSGGDRRKPKTDSTGRNIEPAGEQSALNRDEVNRLDLPDNDDAEWEDTDR